MPPPGITVPAADRAELQAELEKLGESIHKLGSNPLAPDVVIFHNAVRYALEYNEFFKPEEIAKAKALLKHGQERAEQLAAGTGALDHRDRAWWCAATSRRSTAACSRTGWSCRRRIRRPRRIAGAWMPGFTDATRR